MFMRFGGPESALEQMESTSSVWQAQALQAMKERNHPKAKRCVANGLAFRKAATELQEKITEGRAKFGMNNALEKMGA